MPSPRALLLVPAPDWAGRLFGVEPGGGRPSEVHVHLPYGSLLACVAPQIRHDERVARQLSAEDQSYPLPCPCGRKWFLYGGTMVWQHPEDGPVRALALQWDGRPCWLSQARLTRELKAPDAVLRQLHRVRNRRPHLTEDAAATLALLQIAEERGIGTLVEIGDIIQPEGGP